jgi:hypothetical protein
VKIEVSTTERELFIRFNGLTHARIDRRELLGVQSWKTNRGRETPVFSLEFYTRCGHNMLLQYDREDIWKEVLTKLDGVQLLNEWKIEDP